MNLRISLASTLAAALVAGTVSTASAQADTTRRTTAQDSTRRTTSDTTRRATSQRRVRVQKESTGEVTTPSTTRPDSMSEMNRMRADSIARDSVARDSVARADSIARMEQMRRDSVTRDSTARADSIARASAATTTTTTTASSDTIRQPGMPSMSSDSYGVRRGGFYVGLGGGPNIPTGTVSDVYKTGFNVEVPIGWQPTNSILGFRVDLGYSRLNGRSAGTNGLLSQPDDPNIWSATANLTLDLLKFGESRRGALYLVGGGGVFRFTDFFNSDRSDNDPESAFEGDPVTKGGLTGGAGLALPIGGASVFVESRYTTAYTEGNNTRWVPVVFGLKWR